MMLAPPLLAGRRRGLAALLGLLALGEALLAVLFAAALDQVLAAPDAPQMPLLAAGGCAVMIGAALLLARWVGEDFAQRYVADCRAAIFAAVAGNPDLKTNEDARWLTVLLNDMAALRNYALRGTVRLWTSTLAAGAAAGWVALTMPQLAPALVPLMLGSVVVAALLWPLTRAITSQRQARGRLNRFLVRRVRAEIAGAISRKGHGFRKLAELSDEVANASVRRARRAGLMEATAALSGLAAALAVVAQAQQGIAAAGLAGSLTLLGFIAARLLEAARALHARAGGRIALARLERLLDRTPAALPRAARPRSNQRPHVDTYPRRRWLPKMARWLPLRFSLNPALPAPTCASLRGSNPPQETES